MWWHCWSTASQECLGLRQPLRSLDTSLNYVLACVGPSFIVARRPTARTAWAPNNTVIRQLRPAKLCLGLAARAFRAARAPRSAQKASKTRALGFSHLPRSILRQRDAPRQAITTPVAQRCAHSACSLRRRETACAAAQQPKPRTTRNKHVVRQRQRGGHAFT